MTTGIVACLWMLSGSTLRAAAEDPEPPIEAKNEEITAFLRQLHAFLHPYWKAHFGGEAGRKHRPSNEPTLRTVVRVVLTPGGVLKDTQTVEKSDAPEFDELVTKMLWERAPFPIDVPKSALDDDGFAYVEWTFARDFHLCSGLRWIHRREPVDEAMPRLATAGKSDEAWRKLQDAALESPERVLGWYAQTELKKALANPVTAVAAGVGLLAVGDQSGLDIVRAAVKEGRPTATLAAKALVRAGVAICPLTKGTLEKGNAAAKEAAIAALRFAPDKDCNAALLAAAGNQREPVTVRLAAFTLLRDDPEVASRDAALKAAKDDPSPSVRGAVLLAGVQPGAGRAVVFRMTALLKDPSAEVRGAASAAVVRAAGDAGLDQLYRLFSEKDPRPYELVAEELARYATAPTLDLLARMLKRDDRRIRLAAARAIGARSDAPARELFQSLANDPDQEIAGLVLLKVAPETLALRAGSTEPPVGRKIYQQLVSTPRYRPIMADWLLSHYRALDAKTKAEVLQEWLSGAAGATL